MRKVGKIFDLISRGKRTGEWERKKWGKVMERRKRTVTLKEGNWLQWEVATVINITLYQFHGKFTN